MSDVNGFEVIGEIGVNHNGDIDLALKLLDVIRESGAQTAKIQIFEPDLIVSSKAKLADYQSRNGVDALSQKEMLEYLTLTEAEVIKLGEHASSLGLEFLVTPFDLGSLSFVRTVLGHRRVKIGSGDLTFHELIFEAAKVFDQLILSTGMSDLPEVARAVRVAMSGFDVRDGFLPGDFLPRETNITQLGEGPWGRQPKERGLTILHCTSTYPAPMEELNILAMRELAELNSNLGYSDHSHSAIAAIMATALGARVFEKHVTLDTSQIGPDHAASLDPRAFKHYVSTLREAFTALGSGKKEPQPSEQNVKSVARRSIFALRAIEKGEIFSFDNLVSLRPEGTVGAEMIFDLVGKPAKREFEKGQPIEL